MSVSVRYVDLHVDLKLSSMSHGTLDMKDQKYIISEDLH